MVGENEEGVPADRMDPAEALETLGLERARNLAITFFALNYENPKSPTFDWTPLWRHQITVGVVMDFIYDALDLRRTGLEYATGTFHDIGKMILAELFPFAYFTCMNRSVNESIPISQAEREMFKITHAELAAEWLRNFDMPSALVDAIAQHETAAAVSKRNVLAHALISINHLTKQLGIGYSGKRRPRSPPPGTSTPPPSSSGKPAATWSTPTRPSPKTSSTQFETFPDLV